IRLIRSKKSKTRKVMIYIILIIFFLHIKMSTSQTIYNDSVYN
ncbi:unnamed protein product, partial [marine sediment metagenome]